MPPSSPPSHTAAVATPPNIASVRNYLETLQSRICSALESVEESARFSEENWERAEGGGGRSRVIANGTVWEKGGVGFSHVFGQQLPPSATARRPELSGKPWQAAGVSLVIHPQNPYVPTSHANVRFFIADPDGPNPAWWFGGGFDLTPFYPFTDDIVHWHKTARDAVAPFGETLYPHFKTWCDDYFFLKHRGETRGVGGLFFDDYNDGDFERSFALMRAVGDAYIPAYLPIVRKHSADPFGKRERDFQLHRRGRYAEFNLIYDRGTHFGLQSGGRTESILMSLPPLAAWTYNWQAQPGSPEAALTDYLRPREWLG